MTAKLFSFPPYHEMVATLFKVELPGNCAPLLHAALGIAGEGGELKEADNRANFLEECGDLEFYHEACHQQLAILGHGIEEGVNEINLALYGTKKPELNLGTWADVVHQCGSKIIDFTKKAWVYGNREPNYVGCHVTLRDLRAALDFAYELHGTTQEEVRYLNQVKLIGKDGRYATGKYSDEQALARADKKGE